jgi:CspA family cold shock protein
MQTGTVKWFDATKGFGFLIPQDGSDDIYVHAKVLQKAKIDTIETGTVVNYSVGEKGGKLFVNDIAIASVPSQAEPVDRRIVKKSAITTPSADAEDEFEREWGLRRA